MWKMETVPSENETAKAVVSASLRQVKVRGAQSKYRAGMLGSSWILIVLLCSKTGAAPLDVSMVYVSKIPALVTIPNSAPLSGEKWRSKTAYGSSIDCIFSLTIVQHNRI